MLPRAKQVSVLIFLFSDTNRSSQLINTNHGSYQNWSNPNNVGIKPTSNASAMGAHLGVGPLSEKRPTKNYATETRGNNAQQIRGKIPPNVLVIRSDQGDYSLPTNMHSVLQPGATPLLRPVRVINHVLPNTNCTPVKPTNTTVTSNNHHQQQQQRVVAMSQPVNDDNQINTKIRPNNLMTVNV